MKDLPLPGAPEGSSLRIRPALLWQSGAGLVGVSSAFLFFDVRLAAGVGFGVLVVMLSTLLLARRIHGATASDPERGQQLLYTGAVVRFVFVLASLVVACGIGLHLFAVAVGMLLAQVAMFLFAVGGMRAQVKHKQFERATGPHGASRITR
ncbi:MAG: hypothetical protein COS82_02260 [Zetaproteobacteria bacterium CG06_land_8_20_14_3_00_59_53]|nr:MAG: hypothetical protein AUK36_10165 [Zetaproteobacteria bacterium CG2_30_59_37]PIO89748.1 MAG: hypothetical protein COX56_06220 [Zetaproteobacteria bacterium CG23_combo_of_CG06-09_8_20_14_all_59_86]PIQ64000.1 MAG: hypothetical protein COV97_11570 [Zetaproteobacteria bacterium CG11_big_fil_rev_8_21_14_0_20_59_439]PIU71219.1 MAG: hypothetical protein COS82_02260 [Zetaproteobacteria bacterium CG06_land_8_20_14_3_00_59_53]PIU96216.1 MAG: hypothetical protein COS62_10070 [Zetaproteobacteria bac